MKQKGFSLIEVLCSQLILAMAMLSLSSGLSSAGITKKQMQQTDHAVLMAQDIQARVELVVDSYGYLETSSPLLDKHALQTGASGESYDWQLSPLDLRQLHGQDRPLLGKPWGCITLSGIQVSILLQWSASRTGKPGKIPVSSACARYDPGLRQIYLGV